MPFSALAFVSYPWLAAIISPFGRSELSISSRGCLLVGVWSRRAKQWQSKAYPQVTFTSGLRSRPALSTESAGGQGGLSGSTDRAGSRSRAGRRSGGHNDGRMSTRLLVAKAFASPSRLDAVMMWHDSHGPPQRA